MLSYNIMINNNTIGTLTLNTLQTGMVISFFTFFGLFNVVSKV